jgi:hypothetical protein
VVCPRYPLREALRSSDLRDVAIVEHFQTRRLRNPRAPMSVAKLGIAARPAAGIRIPQNQSPEVPAAGLRAACAVAESHYGHARGYVVVAHCHQSPLKRVVGRYAT